MNLTAKGSLRGTRTRELTILTEQDIPSGYHACVLRLQASLVGPMNLFLTQEVYVYEKCAMSGMNVHVDFALEDVSRHYSFEGHGALSFSIGWNRLSVHFGIQFGFF